MAPPSFSHAVKHEIALINGRKRDKAIISPRELLNGPSFALSSLTQIEP